MMLVRAVHCSRAVCHKGIFESKLCCFCSLPNNDKSPLLENGLELLVGVWRRSFPQLLKFKMYQDKRVFADTSGVAAQYWMLIMLHVPKTTQVNLIEFIEGARMATDANLRAINNVEFPKYLATNESDLSGVVNCLKQYNTPASYNKIALQVKKNYLHRSFYVECEAMKVEKAQVARVMYQRLTEQEYEDMVVSDKPSSGLSRGATIEHLKLHVDVATVEDLNLVFLQDKTRYVQQQNVYRVVFESRVTIPEEVDWRIANIYIIKQRVMVRASETSVEGRK